MNQAFVVIIATALFLSLTIFSLNHYGPVIESEIYDQASERLTAAGLDWSTIEIDGRQITLQGIAPTDAAGDKAFELISSVRGARKVINATQLTDERFTPVKKPEAYETRLMVSSGFVRYTGSVPDQETSREINDRTRALFPGRRLENEMRMRPGAPDNWLEALTTLQQRFATYANAEAVIRDSRINVVGAVAAGNVSESKLLAAKLPTNFAAEITLNIAEVDLAENCQQQLDDLMQENINFEVASDIIDRASHDLLDQLAVRIRQCGGLRIEVAGHTDSQGLAMKNLELSQRRAESVVQYLVDAGIDPDQLVAWGYGESRPIADNDSARGRSQNRRIEFQAMN